MHIESEYTGYINNSCVPTSFVFSMKILKYSKRKYLTYDAKSISDQRTTSILILSYEIELKRYIHNLVEHKAKLV
jgi:hypothetical protein